MNLHHPRVVAVGSIAVSLLALATLLGDGPAAQSPSRYEATIRRTAYGIPHITAKDPGSLAFGEGYAFAQDHLCSLADQVVFARGERAQFFGPGGKDVHLQSDIAVKALRVAELAAEDVKRASVDVRQSLAGYAAGYNAYLAEVGVDAVAGWCRGAAWVRPISAEDVAARARLAMTTLVQLTSAVATAAPPGAGTAPPPAVDLPDADSALSNGWAIGKDRSETGRGALLANPHYPWVGANRFWEKHLTIPGTLDVYGVSLLGSPGVGIGFNRHVAWTHTVSAGMRMTGYALQLVPGTPTSYMYEGKPRQMAVREVQVDVRQPDGSLKRVSRRVYFSHHGPVVNFPGLPWTSARAIAIRDANGESANLSRTHRALAVATTLEDVKRAHALGGAAFVNTIVATADGRAFYIDAASAPYLSDAAIKWWEAEVERDGAVKAAYGRRLILLDGSAAAFEWVNDRRAPSPGVVPPALAPQLERPDYVFNANDSYWISHPRAPLTGYSPVHGGERTALSLRSRMNVVMLDDASAAGPSGADGRFSLDEIWRAAFSNRAMSAELIKDDLVQRCAGHDDLARACDVLRTWDGTYNLDSRGAVLWREVVSQFVGPNAPRVFATPFNAADPIRTPRGLATANGETDPFVEILRRAAKILDGARLPLDVALGQVQYAERGGRRIPLHGGLGGLEGVANFVNYAPNTTTLEPDPPLPPLVPGSRGLRREGYPINRGTSFVLAVAFTDDGPRARAVLTYGQSGDPQSPHYTDQTELFSRKGWRDVLFTEAQIRADSQLTTRTITAPRRD